MTQKHHIIEIIGSRATLQANLDARQVAIETDNAENFVYVDDDGSYHITANQNEDATFLDIGCDDITIATGHGFSITDLTEGYVLFGGAAGAIDYDDGFFWDNSNKYLGIGTTTPVTIQEIYGDSGAVNLTITSAHATGTPGISFRTDGTPTQKWIMGTRTDDKFSIESGTGVLAAKNDFVLSGVGVGIGVDTSAVTGSGHIFLPACVSGQQLGYIYKGSITLMHTYAPSTADGFNIFLCQSGNFTMATGASYQSSYNIGIGRYSLGSINKGYHNISLGYDSSYYLTNGAYNVNVGDGAGRYNTTGSRSVNIGLNAGGGSASGVSNMEENTCVGSNAGEKLKDGRNNALFGFNAGSNLTSAGRCIIIGSGADGDDATTSYQLNLGGVIKGRWNSGGEYLYFPYNVGIGSVASLTMGERLRLTAAGSNLYFSAECYRNNATSDALFQFRKSRGGTVDSLVATQDGDNIFEIYAQGVANGAWALGAAIDARQDGNITGNFVPAKIRQIVFDASGTSRATTLYANGNFEMPGLAYVGGRLCIGSTTTFPASDNTATVGITGNGTRTCVSFPQDNYSTDPTAPGAPSTQDRFVLHDDGTGKQTIGTGGAGGSPYTYAYALNIQASRKSAAAASEAIRFWTGNSSGGTPVNSLSILHNGNVFLKSGSMAINASAMSGTEKLYVNGDEYVNGSLGIGAAPTYALDVNTSVSSNYVARIYNPSGTAASGLLVKTASTGDNVLIACQNGSNTFVFIVEANGKIQCPSLPTSNPGAGYLWSNSGVITMGS